MGPQAEDAGVEPEEQIAAPDSALDPGLWEDIFEGSSDMDGISFTTIDLSETSTRDEWSHRQSLPIRQEPLNV